MTAKQNKPASSAARKFEPEVKRGWDEIPIGAVIPEAGNGTSYQTGDWRSERPIVNKEKCINCLFCWVFCPDAAVIVEDEKFVDIDYYHCKGCGICSTECPVKVISMVEEGKAQADDAAKAESNGKGGQ
jgi:pyruvate ferredoxin oxidoreductase delta subunit